MNPPKKYRGTILVVDDNPTNIELLLVYLHENKYRILVTRDGPNALKRAVSAKPDLILLDIMMPGMNGFETCEQLKNNPETNNIPIIFMTALTDIDTKLKGFELGAVDYITKPFQRAEVSARISTHLTIQEQKTKLAQLNASKDRFFSIVAHDMKGAFGSLMNFTQYISKSFDEWTREDLKRLIRDMCKSTEKNYKLLENFLEWSRFQLGATPFRPSNVLLEYIIVQAIQLYQAHADSKSIQITYDFSSETYIQGDPQMLATIFRNLISNAIKFTHNGGTIQLDCNNLGNDLEIIIADDGCGMDKETVDKLFYLDKKHQTEGTAGEKGTGLGLLLCKDLLEKHKGRIRVNSKKGEGTQFRIYLPVST
ncbi:MAG: response regulator receiver sensor signal transduction histidine kinase [Candidatus Magnetoglobus multicellularis str. Araruama]|uniref:histidine kinase n=1 Tax=Candidatus Magnetoglobus multicellularis str. Araruama TaxID=890399 RepID=A0A1V1P8H0_9BACT|nr:MAG: response regulator receiver sensor signal transduction histidine kinase [Candidatus Magnetoglobus multicellularis str. Araruama]